MEFPPHLFDEPDHDVNTLNNLGPLRGLAGKWEGHIGLDVKPTADGGETQAYVEKIVIEAIDPQMNGPQLLYGLRYHTHIVKPGEVEMYHDQVGYWLWEPATETIMLTLSIPRGQAALAVGHAKPDAKSFTVTAERGMTSYGISSNAFLEENFTTSAFTMTVTVEDDEHWSYAEETTLHIKGVPEPFSHTDQHRLTRTAAAVPNPLARAEGAK